MRLSYLNFIYNLIKVYINDQKPRTIFKINCEDVVIIFEIWIYLTINNITYSYYN